MAEVTTAALHARADAAAAAGDFPNALRAAAEALAATPRDHRARLKVGLCFAMLGRPDMAVPVLRAVVDQLAGQGFLLPALGACRDALGIQAEAPEILEALGRIHEAIAGRHMRARARVAPPVMPVTVSEARQGSFLSMDDATLAREAAALGSKLPAGTATDIPEGAVPFFSDLPKGAFVSLVGRLEYLKVPAGHVVVRQGDEGRALYVLIEGEVSVSRVTEDETRELARLGAGSLFGEMALIADKPRVATVTTTHPSELFVVDRKVVGDLAAAHPGLAGDIAGFARRRVLMNLMATSPVFSTLAEGQRFELLKAFEPRVVPAGAVLIREGADPVGLYVVVEGEVEVSKDDASGDRVVLAYLKEGEVFGEIGLIEDRPATASVTAAERAVVLFLSKARFVAYAETHPELKAYLRDLSAERRSETEEAMAADGEILEADDLIIL